MYQSECKDCQVDFISRQIGSTLDSPWKTYWYTFKFRDPIYHALNMDFDSNQTTIWLHNPNGDLLRQIPIKLPQTFPDTRPETALSLARRLHHLIAFS
jgi:hypothetical protein